MEVERPDLYADMLETDTGEKEMFAKKHPRSVSARVAAKEARSLANDARQNISSTDRGC